MSETCAHCEGKVEKTLTVKQMVYDRSGRNAVQASLTPLVGHDAVEHHFNEYIENACGPGEEEFGNRGNAMSQELAKKLNQIQKNNESDDEEEIYMEFSAFIGDWNSWFNNLNRVFRKSTSEDVERYLRGQQKTHRRKTTFGNEINSFYNLLRNGIQRHFNQFGHVSASSFEKAAIPLLNVHPGLILESKADLTPSSKVLLEVLLAVWEPLVHGHQEINWERNRLNNNLETIAPAIHPTLKLTPSVQYCSRCGWMLWQGLLVNTSHTDPEDDFDRRKSVSFEGRLTDFLDQTVPMIRSQNERKMEELEQRYQRFMELLPRITQLIENRRTEYAEDKKKDLIHQKHLQLAKLQQELDEMSDED